MNNTTFGNDSFGYYETVAGGAGAVSEHGRPLPFTLVLVMGRESAAVPGFLFYSRDFLSCKFL